MKNHAVTLLLESAQLVDAVELMIENEDWGQLAETSLTHASTMLTQGREETLSHWLESLPGDYLRRDPWALYWLGGSQ